MAIADLNRILEIFGESSPSEEKQKELYREVLLMTLARASRSDANIHSVEIETICKRFGVGIPGRVFCVVLYIEEHNEEG